MPYKAPVSQDTCPGSSIVGCDNSAGDGGTIILKVNAHYGLESTTTSDGFVDIKARPDDITLEVDKDTLSATYDELRVKDKGITLPKLQDIPTDRIMGRSTDGTGPVELVELSDDGELGTNPNILVTQRAIKEYVDNHVPTIPPETDPIATQKTVRIGTTTADIIDISGNPVQTIGANPNFTIDHNASGVTPGVENTYNRVTVDRYGHVATASFVPESDPVFIGQKGAVNGVATLGPDGKVPTSQLPATLINSVFVVASEAAMLALPAIKADMAIRTDTGVTYVLQNPPATTLANWVLLPTPATGITSVNGDSGPNVTLSFYTQAQLQTSGQSAVHWGNITNKPTFATVATTGNYTDLINKPVIPAAQVQVNWLATTGITSILNKPTLATVATTGAYADLTGRPTIPAAQIQSDWTQANTSSLDFIKNKPAIPAAQVRVDWNATGTGVTSILNKPTLAAVAISGSYTDLSNKPVLAAVALSGSYNDLLNKPTIPNAVLNQAALQVGAQFHVENGVVDNQMTADVFNSPTDMFLAVAGSNKVHINNSGNVGVGGTPDITNKFMVYGTVESNDAYILSAASTMSEYGISTNESWLRSFTTGATLSFWTNDTRRAIITAAGNLELLNQIKIAGGVPGVGKILTSDAAGLATWSGNISIPGTASFAGGGFTVNAFGATAIHSTLTVDGTIYPIAGVSLATGSAVNFQPGSSLTIQDGAGAGKILTSNAGGVATWQTPATINAILNQAVAAQANANFWIAGNGRVGGTFTADAGGQNSDIRFKDVLKSNHEIKTRLSDGIDVLEYTWKDKNDGWVHYGYSAQNIEKLLPTAIMYPKDDKGHVMDGEKIAVNYMEVHTLLIKELTERIQELEKRI